jgi:hypothetical protein
MERYAFLFYVDRYHLRYIAHRPQRLRQRNFQSDGYDTIKLITLSFLAIL